MYMQSTPKALLSLATAGSMLVILPQVRADDDHRDRCRDLAGPFSSVTVPVPPCTSPVGLCTHGVLGGPMEDASYDFTVYTLTPDPNDPSIVVATGKSIVTTKNGQMFTDDVSVLQFSGPSPTDPVSFVTTATINSGTEHWKNSSGQFVAAGVLVLATGQAVGNYTANLCKDPRGVDGDD